VGVRVGVVSSLDPIGKPKTLCEVGEVGVVQQVGKVRRAPRDEADDARGE
jgi:hypothetical protein